MMVLIPALAVASAVLVTTASVPATVDKYHVTPAEHAACDDDAERLCIADYPDEDKLLACMKTNLDRLTPLCQATLKAGLKRRHMPM